MRVRRRDLAAFVAILLLSLGLLALVEPGLQLTLGMRVDSSPVRSIALDPILDVAEPEPDAVPTPIAETPPPPPPAVVRATPSPAPVRAVAIRDHTATRPEAPPPELSDERRVMVAEPVPVAAKQPPRQTQPASTPDVEVSLTRERVKLTWRASPGEVVYRIFNGNGKPVGLTAGTTFVVARSATDECYRIQVIDHEDRVSKLSRIACVTGFTTPLAGVAGH